MTEKRFTIQDERVIKDNQKYVTENGYVFSFKSDAEEVCNLLNELDEENLSLKASATMYRELFLELQRQMKGVTKASDLDSKDFSDLIELSKGNVFDDKLGWIHLPVKELKE